MSIEIDPLELSFRRPFTVEVAQNLTIRNSTPTPVAFKVKTTAPKQYCVRPNSGRVEPGSEVEVQVLLQAMKQDPPMDAKCKDKFLVQTVAITADREFSNIATLWQQLDGNKSAIQEKRIRVVYLPADSPSTLPVATPNRSTVRESMVTPGTSIPAYSSPGDDSNIGDHTALHDQPSSPERTSKKESHELDTAIPSAKNGKPSYEDLQSRLTDAQATITRLKDNGGVRMRKAASGGEENSSSSQKAVQQPPQGNQGVPLNIVAALCLLAFLLAYFFF